MNFTRSPKFQNQAFSDPRTELAYNHVKHISFKFKSKFHCILVK